jgi:hypothetical protein
MWRTSHADPADAPRPGAHQEAAAQGITISVAQQCQLALPLPSFKADEVTVTVTSHRPGVAGQVTVGANFNSFDGSYQGPTTTVGHGQFSVTSTHVEVSFVVLPAAGWPLLGAGAIATWEDGAPQSTTLTYAELACDPLVWWGWLIRVIAFVSSPFSAVRSSKSAG